MDLASLFLARGLSNPTNTVAVAFSTSVWILCVGGLLLLLKLAFGRGPQLLRVNSPQHIVQFVLDLLGNTQLGQKVIGADYPKCCLRHGDKGLINEDFQQSYQQQRQHCRSAFGLKGHTWNDTVLKYLDSCKIKWYHARGIVTPSLTIHKIKGMLPGIKGICRQMIGYLETQEDEFLEGYDLMGKYTTDVVGLSAYGIESNSFDSADSVLRQMSSRMFDGSLKGSVALLCALYAPALGNILRFKILTEDVNQYFIGVVKKAVKQRKEINLTRDDFLQSLINTNNEAEAKGERPVYSDEEMAAHSMTFFLDGYETAAILLGFIMYELSLNPTVQETLRNELIYKGRDLDQFNWEEIHDLVYLDMVVMETLRKHPSGTSFSRLCTRDVLLKHKSGSEVFVEKGTPVILPMFSLHNDPEFFPDPDKFDPLRFTDENQAARPQFCFFPFGGGPRTCPGNKFAMTMVKTAVIAVLLRFRLEPKDIPRGKLELDPSNQFFHSAKNGLWVKYHSINISIQTA